jgi:hypothetical protein
MVEFKPRKLHAPKYLFVFASVLTASLKYVLSNTKYRHKHYPASPAKAEIPAMTSRQTGATSTKSAQQQNHKAETKNE